MFDEVCRDGLLVFSIDRYEFTVTVSFVCVVMM